MIKCAVCGSENEAQALFCGTCGSPLTPAETAEIVKESTPAPDATPTDESVVPGKGGARRDLGTGGETGTQPIVTGGAGGSDATPLPEPEPESTGPTIVCSVCGTVNDASRTYCRKCANELRPQAPPPPPPPPRPTPGRRISPVIVGVAAAGVVVAVGVAIILALGGGGPAASPTSADGTTGPTSGPQTPSATASAQPTDSGFSEGEPEGRIVFTRCDGTTACVLFLINADGTEVGELTDAADGFALDPAFSNSGDQVAYTTPGGIRILDIDSGDIRDHSTTRGDFTPSWSPDDSMLVFAGRRDRDPGQTNDREIRIDGVTVTGPSQPLTQNGVEDFDPVFTPDGESIIWVRGEGDQRELRMMNVASRDQVNLTSDEFNDVDPAVSPDGTTIVFASKRGSGDEFDLFLMDIATREITLLPTMPGDEHDPAWSPGGRYIVVSGGDPDHNNLYLLDRADLAAGFVELTSTDERDLVPHWR